VRDCGSAAAGCAGSTYENHDQPTALNGYLDQRGVARHARPDVLTPMTALPTTAVGKIDKNAIARQLQA
jgi:mycobactin salicyl-AMP ligase